ncbi:hypothetical protein EHQ43_17600 [Leptospira bouyouniensis]|uniref:Outer membrane protein beta-barrel domain-containing protein n=1 Tax=Leptospira bouyouniensis TaxID=2484911 RepID=A0A7I0HM25_9LEPT|nr:hypothetical protein [Leptospira bouyouniensis]TGL02174.1 hypothetical protein EHQ43_17600 [Leptospira bouyouniensis]
MKKIRIKIILLLAISLQQSISADSILENRKFFLEVTTSRSLFIPNTNLHQIDNGVMNKNNDFLNRQEVIGDRTASYGTDDQKLASIYAFENSPKPKLNSKAFSIFMEYLFNPKFGFGISLNNTNFEALNISDTKFKNNLTNDYLNTYLTNQAARENSVIREILLPYNTKSNPEFLQIYTLGLHLAYHFITHPIFDPYVRLGFGYGRNLEDMAIIYKTTLSIGSRVFLAENFYILIEAAGSNFDAYKVPDSMLFEAKKKSLSHAWSLQEYSGKIGLGLAF